MNSNAYAKPKQKNTPTFIPVLGKKLSSRSLKPQFDNINREVSNPNFGHNFGGVQVESPSFKQTCSLALSGPSNCLFGGACHTSPPRVQAKLKISQPNDKYEQEADQVADQVMRMPEPQAQRKGCLTCNDIDEKEQIQTKPIAEKITPLIQRQTEPEEEEEEEEVIQTKEAPGQTPEAAQDVQTDINNLRGTGKPLSESERSFFEPRFGVDFSHVRIHDDARAANVARSVNARAFTLRPDVVFGVGQYSPDAPSGRRLLAHELVHVVQQGGAHRNSQALCSSMKPNAVVQRRFEPDELQEYLSTIRSSREIEDKSDSDDKARAIVDVWKWEGNRRFRLSDSDKILMIREMQEDFTGDDDERAILELLERSSNDELTTIFGAGGITVASLNSDFDGEEWDFLQDFYNRRFDGGMTALLQGRIVPKGRPVRFGRSIGLIWEQRGLQEEQDEPSSRALAAVSYAKSLTRENIWFDSWGNDLRDNDLDGVVDNKEERGPDGSHYHNGSHPYRARICEDPDEHVNECDRSEQRDVNVYYKVCIDIPLESYRAAGITVPNNRWIPSLTNWFENRQRSGQWQVWRAPKFPSTLLPGDYISVEGKEHQHSGIVGIGYMGLLGSVIHLPGPTAMRRYHLYEPSDLHDVIEMPIALWKWLLGFNFIARPRL